ncbi:MAG: Rieske 2Fe-2S domain-containing protein [Chloroflexi bacterium]|nr:Rieske 2Fe-2S domain-containing protein [Chloroflexota bacterium]
MLAPSEYELKDYVQVATLDQLPPGRLLAVELQEEWLCLANVGGKAYALSDECHPGGSLSQGWLEGKTAFCPHGFRWDLATGNLLATPDGLVKLLWPLRRLLVPPSKLRLRAYAVERLGVKVMVKPRVRSSMYYGPWRGKVGGGYRW